MNQDEEGGGRKVKAQAIAFFAMGIRARRDLFQTLFYATKNSAADAWALHRRLQDIQEERPEGAFAVAVGDIMPRHELMNAKNAAEATAQDSAAAFFLIADSAIQRLRSTVHPMDTREIGAEMESGIKLNAMIWALANQARHGHAWAQCDDAQLEAKSEVKIIRALGHDPRSANVARELLCSLPCPSYVDLEEMLLVTAHAALQGTGYRLRMVSAGTFGLDYVPEIVVQ